jgi:hypothetical protein
MVRNDILNLVKLDELATTFPHLFDKNLDKDLTNAKNRAKNEFYWQFG